MTGKPEAANPSPRLAGKIAVVTGAGSGIGYAAATALSSAGATVVLTARTGARLDAAADIITAAGGQCSTATVDIRNPDSIDALFADIILEYGGVDVLVNNAGVLRAGSLLDMPVDDWDDVFHTNLRGTFLCARSAARSMIERGGGKIINVASNFGFKGVPEHAAYCASKAALTNFTRTAAVEWARHNIQVNAIAPGYFATDLNADLRNDEALVARIHAQIPARRMGRPDELIEWFELLAGAGSDFVTGQTFVVDGGQLAR
jgi:NAD(P)-dependent dehydrogenase (short-subunit alcohol dehydrogenase family)